jgi:hypothetical protein
VFGVHAFTQAGRVRRAAFERKVFATDNHPARIDLSETDDVIRRRKRFDCA